MKENKENFSQFVLNKNKRDNNILEIKLFETKTITNMSYMFNNCYSLISLPDFFNWDTKNVTNMNSMFALCLSLKTLPDISKWDTKGTNDMSYMFYGCNKLKDLPDITKWNLNKVINTS